MKTKIKNCCSFRNSIRGVGSGFLLLLFLLSCTEENYITLPQPNKGLVNVYIEGDITNAEAQAKLDTEIGSITENIYVQNTTQLTAVTIKPVGNIRDITVFNNSALKNLIIQGNGGKMNDLTIDKNYWESNGHFLNNFTFSNITEVNNIFIGNHSYLYYSSTEPIFIFNDLITIKGNLQVGLGAPNTPDSNYCKLIFNQLKYIKKGFGGVSGKFTEISFPMLEECLNVNFSIKTPNLTLPKLKIIKNLSFGYNDLNNFSRINEINIPQLEEMNSLIIVMNRIYLDNFNISLPNLNKLGDFISISYGLQPSEVDNVLYELQNLQQTSNKTIYLNNNNQSPTNQGLIFKQNLINKGYNVFTN